MWSAADEMAVRPAVGGIALEDIYAAARRIAPFIRRTPVITGTQLDERFKAGFFLKLEQLQHTGAFKVRGAFNKLLAAGTAATARGIVAVSAGNHARAVAFAARELGLDALVLMPRDTPQNYIDETRRHGARVTLCGTFIEACERAAEFEYAGRLLVHPFDDPLVIAGQGTIGLEILSDVPDVTDVVVSIGGGGLAGGVAAAIKAAAPSVNIWGVETRGAESMYAALSAGRIVTLDRITSVARTLGAPAVGTLAFELAKRHLSGVTVVDDSEALREMFYLLDRVKVLTEPATACTLAAAERLRERFSPDSRVVLVLCGGNIGMNEMVGYWPQAANTQ